MVETQLSGKKRDTLWSGSVDARRDEAMEPGQREPQKQKKEEEAPDDEGKKKQFGSDNCFALDRGGDLMSAERRIERRKKYEKRETYLHTQYLRSNTVF